MHQIRTCGFSGRLAMALLLIGAAGCAGGAGGGLLPSGQPLLPQTEFVLDHAPRVAPVARELNKIAPPNYTLEPGDTVLVEPIRFDSPLRFPADQVILPDGTIDLGRYGRVVVAGKHVEDVEACVEALVNADPEIVKALDEADLAGPERVNVRLIEAQASLFYVLGAVNSPGSYPYTGRETVLDAVLAAGGLADNAKHCRIILSRPSPVGDCRTVLPVCWDQVVQLGDTTTNYQLMPGDRVFVPASGCMDTICSFFCKDKCERCCYPECPCGYASVKCPYPTTYDLGCPPYAGTCPPGGVCPPDAASLLPTPALGTDGVPPAPASGSGPDYEPTPEPAAAPAAEPVNDAGHRSFEKGQYIGWLGRK